MRWCAKDHKANYSKRKELDFRDYVPKKHSTWYRQQAASDLIINYIIKAPVRVQEARESCSYNNNTRKNNNIARATSTSITQII